MGATEPTSAVLIIEDEPVLRSSMVRGLLRDSTAQVVGAATVTEARALIEQLRPSFIISDLDLPDGTGLEVIDILDRLGTRVPILFASAYVPKYRPKIPSRSEIEVREKPIPMQELRAMVEQYVGGAPAAGATDAGPFSAPDYIQLACMCHRSAEIRLERQGVPAGRVYIQDGELLDAEYGNLRGEDAVLRLVYAPDLVARCIPLGKEKVQRMIQAGWQAVLLEAARRFDESGRASTADGGDWSGTFIEEGDEPPFADDESVVAAPPPTPLPSLSARSRRAIPMLPDPPPVSSLPAPGRPGRQLPPIPAPRVVGPKRASAAPSQQPMSRVPTAATANPSAPNAHAEFERHFDDAVDALLRKDYDAALTCFTQAQAFEPTDARVRINLERLKVVMRERRGSKP